MMKKTGKIVRSSFRRSLRSAWGSIGGSDVSEHAGGDSSGETPAVFASAGCFFSGVDMVKDVIRRVRAEITMKRADNWEDGMVACIMPPRDEQ
jgi:hypothetical protein